MDPAPAPANLAYIALGANLGERESNIRRALALLEIGGQVHVLKVSPLLENPAVGGPPGAPAFLNAVAQIQTTLDPRALLKRLLEIERQIGRVRLQKWEPRVIDLDLLLYGDQIIRSDDLSVPHPLMHERRFVLAPLAQIAPEVVHPGFHLTIAQLLDRLKDR